MVTSASAAASTTTCTTGAERKRARGPGTSLSQIIGRGEDEPETCEHTFLTAQPHAHVRFRRAIERRALWLAEDAARESCKTRSRLGYGSAGRVLARMGSSALGLENVTTQEDIAQVAAQLAELTHTVEAMAKDLKAMTERADTQEARADTQEARSDTQEARSDTQE